jgi:hypothetical protein
MIQRSIDGFSTLNAILTLFATNAEASEQEVDTGKDYLESIIDGARNAITKQCPPGTVRESDRTYYVSCLLYTTTSKYVEGYVIGLIIVAVTPNPLLRFIMMATLVAMANVQAYECSQEAQKCIPVRQ